MSSAATGSGFFVTFTVQPAFGCTSTEVNGVAAGKVISSPIVEAASDSDGTRNVMTPEPPWTASTPDTLIFDRDHY